MAKRGLCPKSAIGFQNREGEFGLNESDAAGSPSYYTWE